MAEVVTRLLLSFGAVAGVAKASTYYGHQFLSTFCVGVAWYSIYWIDYTILHYVKIENPVLRLGHHALLFMIVWSYLTAMFASPGYTPLKGGKKKFDALVLQTMQDKASPIQNTSITKRAAKKLVAQREHYCKHCENFKPASAHHCKLCGRCVLRMDHHCPWINNCVGQCNMKYFLQFLFYTELALGFSALLFLNKAVSSFLGQPSRPETYSFMPNDAGSMFMTLLGAFMTLFFFLFIGFMAQEQYEALRSGIPGIDALQGIGKYKDQNVFKALQKDVFDRTSIGLLWFLPLPTSAETTVKKR